MEAETGAETPATWRRRRANRFLLDTSHAPPHRRHVSPPCKSQLYEIHPTSKLRATKLQLPPWIESTPMLRRSSAHSAGRMLWSLLLPPSRASSNCEPPHQKPPSQSKKSTEENRFLLIWMRRTNLNWNLGISENLEGINCRMLGGFFLGFLVPHLTLIYHNLGLNQYFQSKIFQCQGKILSYCTMYK